MKTICLGSPPTSKPTMFPLGEMASTERKMQFGGWTKRDWRQLRPRLKKEVKEIISNLTTMTDETPETPAEPVKE